MSDEKIILNLLDALCDALPYVEDVLDDKESLKCFKKGVVQGHAKAIRYAIHVAEKHISERITK